MKQFYLLAVILFSGAVLLTSYGCYKSMAPLNPVDQQIEQKPDQSMGISSESVTLGIKKLYVAPIVAKIPKELREQSAIDLVLDILPVDAKEQLISEHAVALRDTVLITTLGTLTGIDEPIQQCDTWIVALAATWGCIKACYSDEPPCTPCPECCDRPRKRDNYKFTIY